jgi:RNA-directed DNA polymerase
MNSEGNVMSRMLEWDNLLLAVVRAGQGRREQPEVRQYAHRLEPELIQLRTELASGSPACGQCQTFTIYDPKERLITAPIYRERVMHHAVMGVCGPVLEQRLMHHTYACRVGKGTFRALDAAQRGAAAMGWFVKLDVRKFFDSIPRMTVLEMLARVFREERVYQIFRTILYAYSPGERGLPIGSLVSQHVANYYLSALDTYILQELRPHAVVRYMDDLAVWCREREQALDVLAGSRAFLAERLGLTLKTGFVQRTAQGMDFLGHRIYPHRITLSAARRRRFREHATLLHHLWVSCAETEAKVQERGTALVAATAHADCLVWRRGVFSRLKGERDENMIAPQPLPDQAIVKGERPQARTASCVAAVGSTTASTPDPPTAMAGSLSTATTTRASALAPAGSRSAQMEQVTHPAPASHEVGQNEKLPPLASNSKGQQAGANASGGSASTLFPSFSTL